MTTKTQQLIRACVLFSIHDNDFMMVPAFASGVLYHFSAGDGQEQHQPWLDAACEGFDMTLLQLVTTAKMVMGE
jgi:hypothetical protein